MFERGLPGYDDWLDNHGNPGITDDDGYDWALTDPKVIVTKMSDSEYLIRRYDSDESLTIKIEQYRAETRYLFDGAYVYTENFMQWVGLLDEFGEQDEKTAIIGHDDADH